MLGSGALKTLVRICASRICETLLGDLFGALSYSVHKFDAPTKAFMVHSGLIRLVLCGAGQTREEYPFVLV
jgi:hypothetical protein